MTEKERRTIEERLTTLECYAHTNCYKCGKEVLVNYLDEHPLCKLPLCYKCFREFDEFADNAKNDYLNKVKYWLREPKDKNETQL